MVVTTVTAPDPSRMLGFATASPWLSTDTGVTCLLPHIILALFSLPVLV